MSDDSATHSHSWWRTRAGGLECACGASKAPGALTMREQAEVARFGIFDNDEPEL